MPDWTARLIVLPIKNDWFLACFLPFSVRSILSHIPRSFYAFKKSYKISFSIDLIDVSLFSHQCTGRHSHLLNRKWLETHLFISPWAKGLLYNSWTYYSTYNMYVYGISNSFIIIDKLSRTYFSAHKSKNTTLQQTKQQQKVVRTLVRVTVRWVSQWQWVNLERCML